MLSGPGREPRARRLSEALKKLKGAVLMSVVLVATEGGAKASGLGHRLEPRWCLRVMLLQGPCQSGWPVLPPGAMVIFWPRLR